MSGKKGSHFPLPVSFSTSLSVTIGQAICYLMANLRYGGATRHAGAAAVAAADSTHVCMFDCSCSLSVREILAPIVITIRSLSLFLSFFFFALLDAQTRLIATWDCARRGDIPKGFFVLFLFYFSYSRRHAAGRWHYTIKIKFHSITVGRPMTLLCHVVPAFERVMAWNLK